MKHLWICVVALVCWPSIGFGFEDDFSDSVLDPVWEFFVEGEGPLVSVENAALQVVLPSDCADNGLLFGGGIRAGCVFEGDFDIQVDFMLSTWPATNGVRVGIGVLADGVNGYSVAERISFGGNDNDFPDSPPESYGLDVSGGIEIIPGTGVEGSLRLIRAGSTWTGFYSEGGGWLEIGSRSGRTDPIRIELVSWSHDYAFSGEQVVVRYDNFRVNSGIGCEGVVATDSSTFGHLKALYR